MRKSRVVTLGGLLLLCRILNGKVLLPAAVKDILSWAIVIPSVITLALGGFGVLTLPRRPEYRIAQGLFVLATVYFWLSMGFWGLTTTRSIGVRAVVLVFALGVTGWLLIEGIRLVEGRKQEEQAAPEQGIKTLSPAPSPDPIKLTEPNLDLFRARRRDALLGMDEKKFPYQAVGDKNQVEILCRLDLPVHNRPTLSIYIPRTANVESATNAGVYAVTQQKQIIEILLAEIRKDETKALALKAQPFKVQQVIIYHEIFIERTTVITAFSKKFHGRYEFHGSTVKPPRHSVLLL